MSASDSKARQAACSCGRLRVTARGEPTRISMCHCLECQRRTGSAFGLQARFADADVTIEGPSKAYARTADTGNLVTFHFCPECGSTVYYVLEKWPGAIAIAVGAFADPGFPAPIASVHEERRHAWVTVPEGAEHFAGPAHPPVRPST
ncbi:MAG: GFA family protein [Polyangiaceae bacterium]